jgi:hypothetical protein
MFAPIKTALLALSLSLAACSVGAVEGGGTDGGNTNPNQQTFMTVITPLVMTKCTGCHSGGSPPNLSSFAALDVKYKTKPGNTNVLVTKGNHSGVIYFDATDQGKVAMWIDNLVP